MISPREDASAPLSDRIAALAHKVLAGQALERAEVLPLTQAGGEELYDLFYWANKIRVRYIGRSVRFCSIIAAKVGNCSEDCGYCSQSAHHKTHVTPQKLTVEEMLAASRQALANGASSIGIVNSGRGPTNKELDWIEPFFREIAAGSQIRPCATLGDLKPEQAQRLRDAGVLRINHNLETSRRHFPNIITTHSYDDRVHTIKLAKAAGLSICSGGIFGMGENWDDRIDMALELRNLGVDVVPINFLNAIPGTTLYGQLPDLTPLEALQIISVYRFLLPDKELKICGGRDKILRDLVSWIFFAGASSFMIGNYLTTYGRAPELDHQMLRDLGIPYVTFDEMEHETTPAPGNIPGIIPQDAGVLASLPVVG